MDWDRIYKNLHNMVYGGSFMHYFFPPENMTTRVQLLNYPPRVSLDIGFVSLNATRRESHTELGFVYEAPTDEELNEAADTAMDFYHLCGSGLKIYRDTRPEKGIVRYTVKPYKYEDWQ